MSVLALTGWRCPQVMNRIKRLAKLDLEVRLSVRPLNWICMRAKIIRICMNVQDFDRIGVAQTKLVAPSRAELLANAWHYVHKNR